MNRLGPWSPPSTQRGGLRLVGYSEIEKQRFPDWFRDFLYGGSRARGYALTGRPADGERLPRIGNEQPVRLRKPAERADRPSPDFLYILGRPTKRLTMGIRPRFRERFTYEAVQPALARHGDRWRRRLRGQCVRLDSGADSACSALADDVHSNPLSCGLTSVLDAAVDR